jgi:hypothetical protein
MGGTRLSESGSISSQRARVGGIPGYLVCHCPRRVFPAPPVTGLPSGPGTDAAVPTRRFFTASDGSPD